jgi:hypothetical protein
MPLSIVIATLVDDESRQLNGYLVILVILVCVLFLGCKIMSMVSNTQNTNTPS